MPGKKGPADDFLSQLGKEAHEAHAEFKDREVEYSQFSDLPAGINNGIAQLVECRFDKVKEGKPNAGKYYFYAVGAVKRPKVGPDGAPLYGLHTRIIEPLYATPNRTRKTVKDHLGFVYNELGKLGINTSQLSGPDQLPRMAAALEKAKPFFRFRTWKGTKATTGEYAGRDPMVQHVWNGTVEFSEDDDNLENDQTQAIDPETSGEAAGGDEQGAGQEDAAFDEFGDLDSLAARADEGEDAAIDELTEIALKTGFSEEEITEAESWASVVEQIRAKAEEGTGGEDEGGGKGDEGATGDVEEKAESNGQPEKGDLFRFRPMAGKKRAIRAIEVEVTSVNKSKRLATVKSLDDPSKVYKDVPWDDLKSPE